MSELVCLPISLVQCDEDAHVVLARQHLDRGACELGGDLVETSSGDTLLGAGDVKCADWRVMRGLLGEVGDADEAVVLAGAMLGDGQRHLRRVIVVLNSGLQAR